MLFIVCSLAPPPQSALSSVLRGRSQLLRLTEATCCRVLSSGSAGRTARPPGNRGPEERGARLRSGQEGEDITKPQRGRAGRDGVKGETPPSQGCNGGTRNTKQGSTSGIAPLGAHGFYEPSQPSPAMILGPPVLWRHPALLPASWFKAPSSPLTCWALCFSSSSLA